jgi:hypothetical protein
MKTMLFRALAPLMVAAFPFAALAEEVPLSVTMDGAVALQASILAEGTLNEAQVQVLKDNEPNKRKHKGQGQEEKGQRKRKQEPTSGVIRRTKA